MKKTTKIFIVAGILAIITAINIFIMVDTISKLDDIGWYKGYTKDYYEEKQRNASEEDKLLQTKWEDLPRLEYEIGKEKKIISAVTIITGVLTVATVATGIILIVKEKKK